ncbi:MAG: Peroxiredoxin [Planctomycetota bacterium]|nr:Peroxiredoxin [Planctomycetota bacterium]
MSRASRLLALGLIVGSAAFLRAQAPAAGPPYKKVSELLEAHDRRLVRELVEYAEKNPKADDLEQAYMALFEKVIQHDWFLDHDRIARSYLADHPAGAVRPMAQIVATMARAQDGKFADAAVEYKSLMKALDQDEQEEFASNFADSLASAAMVAGEHEVAKQVYDALLDRFGENARLRAKVKDDLERIAMVGKPAPNFPVRDRAGVTFRLSDYKGKYVLVDFWATWCAPCVAELPNLQAAYKTYHDRGFEVLSVSLDETTAPLNDFLKTHAMPWRQVHNASCGGDVVDAFAVNTIPATFLVGPDGTIVRLELRGAALEKALAKLIK